MRRAELTPNNFLVLLKLIWIIQVRTKLLQQITTLHYNSFKCRPFWKIFLSTLSNLVSRKTNSTNKKLLLILISRICVKHLSTSLSFLAGRKSGKRFTGKTQEVHHVWEVKHRLFKGQSFVTLYECHITSTDAISALQAIRLKKNKTFYQRLSDNVNSKAVFVTHFALALQLGIKSITSTTIEGRAKAVHQ